jgi:hypothetical protein
MESNLSKVMAMVNGQDRNDFDCKTVSIENRTKIDDAIESVFIGKSMLVWVNGGKLINAWNTALDNLRDELFSIPNTSNVVAYLRQAVFNHRTNWKHKMMQSNERNSIALFKNNTEKEELVEHANALINTGFNTIKYIIENSSCDSAHKQNNANTHKMVRELSMTRERTYERTRKK